MYRYPEAMVTMVSWEKLPFFFKVLILKLLTSRERVHIFLAQHLSSFKTGNMYSVKDRKIKIGWNKN